MIYDDIPKLSRRLRREPIAVTGIISDRDFEGGLSPRRLLPHREPFLLLDKLVAYDLDKQTISAERFISSSDPVMQGHFPGEPAYPGVLQIEMIGQAALCLIALLLGRKTGSGAQPRITTSLRGVRLYDGIFLSGIVADRSVNVRAEILEVDSPSWVFGGQILHNDQIISSSIAEVYVPDE